MIKKVSSINEILYILDNIRKEDKEELTALFGNAWYNKIFNYLKNKDFLVLYGKNNFGIDVPIAMGDISESDKYDKSVAYVWLLSSNYIYNNKILFMNELKKQISEAENHFSILYNFIYKSNFSAKKWLRKLGFCFNNPKPLNMGIREDFEFFYKVIERKDI